MTQTTEQGANGSNVIRACVVCGGSLAGLHANAKVCSSRECRRRRKAERERRYKKRAAEASPREPVERALADVRLALDADLFSDRPGQLGTVHHRLLVTLQARRPWASARPAPPLPTGRALVELAAIAVEAASKLPPVTAKFNTDARDGVAA